MEIDDSNPWQTTAQRTSFENRYFSTCTYIARGLSFSKAAPDPTEQLKLRKLPLSEAIDLAVDGTIRDSISVAALLKLRALGLG